MKKVELLSPVGNFDMLYQAIHNGADAVYLAGCDFGARKFSKNFTNDELIEAIKYSHVYGVFVYVTVNTLIYECEVENFISYIEFLYANGVDALIMQDIGMIKLVHDRFPDFEIHASTQCHNHNEEGIKLLKELGCSRVVFAREMSLDEIKNINIDIEKEVFVYGALCICYSGCCLFSSLNGGRSGNRGECVGSCRLPYKLIKNEKQVKLTDKYLLSAKELNTINNLKEILDSGIDSLKIEGRMKTPAYVGYVTKLYRMLIDKYYQKQDTNLQLTKKEMTNLKLLYNREFTKGYLFNDVDITNTKSPNHIGIELGKVIKVTNKYIYIKLNYELNQEDGIRFKKVNKGMIVNKLYDSKNKLTSKVNKGNICMVDNKIGLKENDIVLKTLSSKLIKELEVVTKKVIKVNFRAKFRIGKSFSITISDGNNEITEFGDVVDKAIKREVTTQNIKTSISKLGATPFDVDDIKVEKDDGIFVNLKSINEVRRKLVDKLIEVRSFSKRRLVNYRNICGSYIEASNNISLNVLVRNEEQLKCCIDNKVDNIYIADYDLYIKYKSLDNVYYRCNRVNNNYRKFNNSKLLVCEMGSINKYKNNNFLVSDYYLNVTNSYSIKVLNSLGAERVTLSSELDFNKIRDIMKCHYNVELIIYGRLELMVMKYCPLKKCLNYCDECKNSCDNFSLEDRFGNRFPIIRKNCLTHIMHFKNIDYIDDLKKYIDIGITNFRIELFDENYKMVENCIKKARNML